MHDVVLIMCKSFVAWAKAMCGNELQEKYHFDTGLNDQISQHTSDLDEWHDWCESCLSRRV